MPAPARAPVPPALPGPPPRVPEEIAKARTPTPPGPLPRREIQGLPEELGRPLERTLREDPRASAILASPPSEGTGVTSSSLTGRPPSPA